MDTKKQRQCRRDDARLIESGNTRTEQLLSCGAYRVTDQQRMAARRALEWIGTSEARLDFGYETKQCSIMMPFIALLGVGGLLSVAAEY